MRLPTRAIPQAVLWDVVQVLRSHDNWTIENRKHYVRDVTFGEDHGQAYTDSTPQALAALRNRLIDLMRAKGWTNIADAIRYYGASLPRSLDRIAAFSFRL